MQELGNSEPVAELSEPPTWEEFYSEYIRPNKPVVLRGLARHLQAFETWTDEYLLKHWANKKVEVELNKTETRGGRATSMTLEQFMNEMYRDSRKHELYAIVSFDEDQRVKSDVVMPSPTNCKEISPQSLTLWLSSGGTTSVLHQDDAENFLMLLDGHKKVMLVHQDESERMYAPIAEAVGTSPVHQESVDLVNFPRFGNIPWLKGELGPGDALYIPHTYWHQVNSFGRNVALNMWWGHLEDWRWWNPENMSEYDATRFGSKDFISFDTLKGRAPVMAPCTPRSSGADLNKWKFRDDDKFKQYLVRKRREASRKGEL